MGKGMPLQFEKPRFAQSVVFLINRWRSIAKIDDLVVRLYFDVCPIIKNNYLYNKVTVNYVFIFPT